MLSSLGTASPRCAVTPLHCSLNRATAALHGDCDAILGQPALSHRRSRPLVMADAPRPRPQLSGALLVSDCAALVVYGLLASALKAFALAGSDLLSPVCHRRLEPRLAELRQVCLLLTRSSLALDRALTWPPIWRASTSTRRCATSTYLVVLPHATSYSRYPYLYTPSVPTL